MARQVIDPMTIQTPFAKSYMSTLQSVLENKLQNQFQEERLRTQQKLQEEQTALQRDRQRGTYGALGKILQQQIPEGTDRTGFILDAISKNPNIDPSVIKDVIGRGGILGVQPQSGTSVSNLPSPEMINPQFLENLGFDPENAKRISKLYGISTTGGRTQITKFLMDQMQRGKIKGIPGEEPSLESTFGIPQNQGLQEDFQESENISSVLDENNVVNQPDRNVNVDGNISSKEVEEFKFPEFNNFKGKNDAERDRLQRDFRRDNLPLANEANRKLDVFDEIERRNNQLEKLNNRRNLEEGVLSKAIYLDKNGNIRVPEWVHPDTEAFVKNINDYLSLAKDFFGTSRLTNFMVGSFKQRLPSLMNTHEGRRIILDQLKSFAELEKVKNKSILDTYKHYGIGSIDPAQAQQTARELRSKEEEKIESRFNEILDRSDLKMAYEDPATLSKLRPGYIFVKPKGGSIIQVKKSAKEEVKKRGGVVLDD